MSISGPLQAINALEVLEFVGRNDLCDFGILL